MNPEEIKALQDKVAAIEAEKANLAKELESLKAKPAPAPAPTPTEDEDLITKARKDRQESEKKDSDIKQIESALRFNLSAPEFLKQNKDLLPADVENVMKVAEKENYDSAAERANAVRAGLVAAFFAQQSNLDLLTSGQKAQLEDFNKLTKKGREEKAQQIYENIFEPALATLRKVKKAEELGKANAGFAKASDVESQYKERLMKMARKTYLKETNV